MGKHVKYEFLEYLAEKYNIPITDLRELRFREKCETVDELEVILIEKEYKKKAAQKLFKRFEDELGVSVNGLTEARKSIKDLGFNFDNTISDLNDMLDIIKWSKEFNYEWLLNPKEPFTYNGIEYKRFRSLLAHHRMIKVTLFKNILKYKGDLRLAIISSENDPEYAARIAFSAGGHKFNTIHEASIALGFNHITFKRLLREGKSQEEAYKICMNTIRDRVESEWGFPVLFKGEMCNTRRQLADMSGMTRHRLYKYIEILGLTELVHRLENDISLMDNEREVIDFGNKFNMTPEQVRLLKKGSIFSFDELEEKFNSEKLYYKGNLYYSPVQVEDIEGLNRRQIASAWVRAQTKAEDIEGRSRVFEESLSKYQSQSKLKTSNIFT